jgi:hypothetical protein
MGVTASNEIGELAAVDRLARGVTALPPGDFIDADDSPPVDPDAPPRFLTEAPTL